MLTQIAETTRGNAESTRALTIEVRRLADAATIQNGRIGRIERDREREETGEAAVRKTLDRWKAAAGWGVGLAASIVAVIQAITH